MSGILHHKKSCKRSLSPVDPYFSVLFSPVSILETSLLPLFSIPFTLNVNTVLFASKSKRKKEDSDSSNFSIY